MNVEHEFLEQVAGSSEEWSLDRSVRFLGRYEDPSPVSRALYRDECVTLVDRNGTTLPAWRIDGIFRNRGTSEGAEIVVRYARSEGPYVDTIDGTIRPASDLMSSGSDSGFVITVALLTFSISVLAALAALAGRVGGRALAGTYLVNYLVYACLVYAVDLDVSLVESIRFGDRLLLLVLVVPAVPILLGLARRMAAWRGGFRAASGGGQ